MSDAVSAEVAAAALEVAGQFAPGRPASAAEPLGEGHIHITLQVAFEDGGTDFAAVGLS